ncbi:MAG: tetratricopeptide repeat protein [Bilophila wadsworthia]
MTDQTFGKNRRSILLLITAGLVLMLVSTLSYFSANPGLVSHTTTGTQAAAPSGQQMPTSAGMDEATQQGVMALMQKLQKNPTDLEALVGLTEHFMHTQDWQRAETFALRAVVAAPNETQPLYMLGIIQHSQNRNAEAAASLERSSPPRKILPYATAFGILYAYYLEQPDKGLEQLQKALDNPNTLRISKAVAEEVRKSGTQKPHASAGAVTSIKIKGRGSSQGSSAFSFMKGTRVKQPLTAKESA